MEVQQLAPDDARARVDAGALMVDVRELGEWQQARIPGAVHAPLSRFMEHLESLPKDRQLVITCAVGGRSQQAAAWLQSQGYEAHNLSGGIHAWHAAGFPIDQ